MATLPIKHGEREPVVLSLSPSCFTNGVRRVSDPEGLTPSTRGEVRGGGIPTAAETIQLSTVDSA